MIVAVPFTRQKSVRCIVCVCCVPACVRARTAHTRVRAFVCTTHTNAYVCIYVRDACDCIGEILRICQLKLHDLSFELDWIIYFCM